jgi:hypothetical protein
MPRAPRPIDHSPWRARISINTIFTSSSDVQGVVDGHCGAPQWSSCGFWPGHPCGHFRGCLAVWLRCARARPSDPAPQRDDSCAFASSSIRSISSPSSRYTVVRSYYDANRFTWLGQDNSRAVVPQETTTGSACEERPID